MATRSLIAGMFVATLISPAIAFAQGSAGTGNIQPVSASHTAQRDQEYEEAVGLSSPGQQRTLRAETSISRPPKEIRCRRQMWFRGTRAATADNPVWARRLGNAGMGQVLPPSSGGCFNARERNIRADWRRLVLARSAPSIPRACGACLAARRNDGI